jgi:hypothetical protein
MSASNFDVLRGMIPMASGYQPELLDNVFKINSISPKDEAKALSRQDRRTLPEYRELLLVR